MSATPLPVPTLLLTGFEPFGGVEEADRRRLRHTVQIGGARRQDGVVVRRLVAVAPAVQDAKDHRAARRGASAPLGAHLIHRTGFLPLA